MVLGWIGDNIGRKSTVIITTFIMAISCFIMATTLPTYAEKGIVISWILIICRMSQGVSSMGEIVGAELYVTETTKPPVQYTYVDIINIAAQWGGIMALAFGIISITYLFNWHYAFWGGTYNSFSRFYSKN
ncbi:MFS transporter [Candidatus Rickettsia colombianensi]|uniref:MFS transporter n=1 Tax=Candidatus Rickettsia colombianensi TaxID=1090944 RepID=UPI001FE73485|nr:MFS transporter [Candidatus Rickettsia colombianensi]